MGERALIISDVSVSKRSDTPDSWGVEAFDYQDGVVFLAVFSGPSAENRALEYAALLRSGKTLAAGQREEG